MTSQDLRIQVQITKLLLKVEMGKLTLTPNKALINHMKIFSTSSSNKLNGNSNKTDSNNTTATNSGNKQTEIKTIQGIPSSTGNNSSKDKTPMSRLMGDSKGTVATNLTSTLKNGILIKKVILLAQ
jgi:hypothetical protein